MCQPLTPPRRVMYRRYRGGYTPSITHVNLKVIAGPADQDGTFFRMKRTTRLRRLMNAYCERLSVDPNAVVFMFDGHRVEAERTPHEMQMEDGDEMEAYLHT